MESLYPQYLRREETSRQQVLAAKKREGKQVATAESVDASGRRSAHSKRSKEPKGKGVALPQDEENEDITEEDQAPHKRAKMSTGKKVDTERDRTKTPTEDELYGHLKNGVLWPPIRFADIKIMEELEIALGLQDLEESSIPILYDVPREESIARMVWKVLAGKTRKRSRDKNASIRHPSVRYLHRLIVHTIFPRKEPGTVNDEELQLLHQTVQHYAHPSQLPLVDADFYKNFGMLYSENLNAMKPSHYGAFKDIRKEINHLDSSIVLYSFVLPDSPAKEILIVFDSKTSKFSVSLSSLFSGDL
ncbi:hypothetical protein F2Q68_00027065 [Brassica cretica]|uniref:Arabidopsis retrotransposon Orf1 C-terminal domain-containing protein n=1 Tax=Brassica cretica TaxID=69181 RepID=A0A8S9II10_BRACR|nr:hypothetical protein F2Q68_00027065 [Brassica cretica]